MNGFLRLTELANIFQKKNFDEITQTIEAPISKERFSDETLSQLREALETDVAARKRIETLLPLVISKLESFYQGRQKDLERLHDVSNRIIVAIEPARRAFEERCISITDRTHLRSYYTLRFDFIMFAAELDESEELEETLFEEIMHYMRPLPEKMLLEFDKNNGGIEKGFYNFLNEAATLYYLRLLLGRETHVNNKSGVVGMFHDHVGAGEILKRDMGVRIWKKWVEKYGEKSMQDFFFGRQEPEWLADTLKKWDWWRVTSELISGK